jgi:hypothetical protein
VQEIGVRTALEMGKKHGESFLCNQIHCLPCYEGSQYFTVRECHRGTLVEEGSPHIDPLLKRAAYQDPALTAVFEVVSGSLEAALEKIPHS